MINKAPRAAIDVIDRGTVPKWISDHLTAYRESGGRERSEKFHYS